MLPLIALGVPAIAQNKPAASPPWSARMAQTVEARYPDGNVDDRILKMKWNYNLGTLLEGMETAWRSTADPQYFNYIKSNVDSIVTEDGSISGFDPQKQALDDFLMGRQLLMLYRVTRQEKYWKAATQIYKAIEVQPRNPSGGFWHKGKYPNEMWLDGLYMAEPFYAEYSVLAGKSSNYADVVHQFVLIDKHLRDPRTGLLFHEWDETKKEPWADKVTGASPNIWARSIGWYMMALVDTLDILPGSDPNRAVLLPILNRYAEALVCAQDKTTGLWWQLPALPTVQGNYFESSATCMFTYAFFRGVNRGYLPVSYAASAQKAWSGIQSHFLTTTADGLPSLTSTVDGTGLGGNPYHDGSAAYYLSVRQRSDDARGLGPFLMAAVEQEAIADHKIGAGKTVMVDGWFNRQHRLNAAGVNELFHYKWDDRSDSGFSFVGDIFHHYGAQTTMLEAAPTAENLASAQIYLIVSPDTKEKTPQPNYISAEDAKAVVDWVRKGGVLMLMANDSPNTDLAGLNRIAALLGMNFAEGTTHHVIGNNIAAGTIVAAADGEVFHSPHTLYMKDTTEITVPAFGHPVVTDKEGVAIATVPFGKGMVLAVIDPWIYNEYTDGRRLPAKYDNFAAAQEVVRWLLTHVHTGQSLK
jgi:unsaturated rhamnogalacturonyl hydrolase